MSNSFLGFPENPLNLKEHKKKTNPNLKSLWAFLSSTFIYISAFYIFNLSPSALLSTTKFWFFISNTLVLIIAADFAAFSAAKQRDFNEEHVIKDTISTSSETTAFPSSNVVSFKTKTTSHAVIKEEEKPCEKIISTVVVNDHREKKREKYVRSNSANAVIMAATAAEEEGKAVVLHRTLSETCDREEVEDEFSRMSDEELNRRVEEFIQRFNKQIRLQAIRNRQNM